MLMNRSFGFWKHRKSCILKRITASFSFACKTHPSDSFSMRLRLPSAVVATTSLLTDSTFGWISPNSMNCHDSRSVMVSHRARQLCSTIQAPLSEEEKVISVASVDAASVSPSSSIHGPHGKVVAEGQIVSKFSGGFAVIHVNDGDDDYSINVASRTTSAEFEKAAASSSSTSNLSGDYVGRNLLFPDGSHGIVVAHRPPLVFCYSAVMDNEVDAAAAAVQVLSTMSSVPASSLSHSVVDAFGISESVNEALTLEPRAIFAPIPQIKDIALINYPCLTGVTMMDVLAPIGRGQNMLLVGPDSESMRGYAFDLLRTQSQREDTVCVYAAIDNIGEVQKLLKKSGLANKVHLVRPSLSLDASPTARAAEAVTMAGTACAMAEAHALQRGKHVTVVIDTLDHHKILWDATTRVLVDVFGADAVVQSDRSGGASSEMRAFYSTLIQRSSQYKQNRGGGSVTLLLLTTIPSQRTDKESADDESDAVFNTDDFAAAPAKVQERVQWLLQRNVPLTAPNLRKVNLPIPSAAEGHRRFVLQHIDDLISMSDGQIWLDDDDDNGLGQALPPMDPQRSLTRIGIGADTQSRADAPALRRVVEGVRLDLSQAADLAAGEVQATLAATKQRLRQQSLLLAMHQAPGQGGRSLWQSCTALLAASQGHLNAAISAGTIAGSAQGEKLVHDLLAHVQKSVLPDALASIDESLDIPSAIQDDVDNAIADFFANRDTC